MSVSPLPSTLAELRRAATAGAVIGVLAAITFLVSAIYIQGANVSFPFAAQFMILTMVGFAAVFALTRLVTRMGRIGRYFP